MKKFKKGFTLIELLAVIIILAVVALIATPLILNVIDDARESANLSEANLILRGAENLYASNLLQDSNDLFNKNVYDLIQTSGEKPEVGEVFIKSDGQISFKVIIDETCYGKTYDETVISICSFEDSDIATSKDGSILDNLGSVDIFTDNDVFSVPNSDLTIENYGYEFKYCISNTTCTPDITGSNSTIKLNSDSLQTICVSMYNESLELIKQCKNYVVDNDTPTITASEKLTIMQSTDHDPRSFFTVTHTQSDGTFTVSLANTKTLSIGTHTITGTVTNKSGISATATQEVEIVPFEVTPESCFTINSSGAITAYSCSVTDLVIPDTINGIAVTTINSSVFNSKSLMSVKIPDAVTYIGDSAFSNNSISLLNLTNNLRTLGIATFAGNKIYELNFPSSLTTIGRNAFKNNRLESLVIPETITYLRDSIFQSNNLKSVELPNTLTGIGNYAFNGNPIEKVTIPSSVTSIGSLAFAGTKEVNFEPLTGNYSYYNNNIFDKNLKKVVFEDGWTSIDYPFLNKTNYLHLDEIIFPDTLENIGANVFNCYVPNYTWHYYNTIDKIIIPDSVRTIGGTSFYHCGIKDLGIGNSVETIGDSAFTYNNLTTVSLPDSLTSLGKSSFQLGKLESVKMGSGLTILPQSAFGNNNISNIVIPEGITTIETSAFFGNNISEIILPKSLTTLGSSSFGYNKLTNIYIYENLINADTNSFGSGADEDNTNKTGNIYYINENVSGTYPTFSISSKYETYYINTND